MAIKVTDGHSSPEHIHQTKYAARQGVLCRNSGAAIFLAMLDSPIRFVALYRQIPF